MYRICIYTCGVSAHLYNWSFFIQRSLSQNITIRFFGRGSPPLRANSTIESLPRATPVAPALTCFPSLWKECRPPRAVVSHSCPRITSRVLGVPPARNSSCPTSAPVPRSRHWALGSGARGSHGSPPRSAEPWCPPRGPTDGRVGGWEGTLPAAGRVGLGVSMMPAPVDPPS